MIKTFEDFYNDRFDVGDYVKLKKLDDIGKIESKLTGVEGFIVGFLQQRGGRGSVFITKELEKITKEEYELARDTKKYNM